MLEKGSFQEKSNLLAREDFSESILKFLSFHALNLILCGETGIAFNLCCCSGENSFLPFMAPSTGFLLFQHCNYCLQTGILTVAGGVVDRG